MYRLVPAINAHVFRGYDIRGLVGSDLDENVFYTLGRAYATFLKRRRIVTATVGRDNRRESEVYAKAFIKGLNDGGINSIDLGQSLSQIVYFSSYEFKTRGSAMVTASHNPKEYNGLKLGVGYSEGMVASEIKELQKIVEAADYSQGLGEAAERDVFPAYQNDVLKYFTLKKRWRLVVDTCQGTGGLFYPAVFRGAGCQVIEQNTDLDSSFTLGLPDPTDVRVLSRLADGVKRNEADLGLAYDADGDRLAVVDERGESVRTDTLLALFVKDVLKNLPGSVIVYNSLCSKQVSDTIKAFGGQGVLWLTGHSFIEDKLRAMRSPLGGELSGHIFFSDNFYGHEDGAFAALRLLEFLEEEKKTLSQCVSELPQYVSSPEIKLGCSDEVKFNFVEEKIAPEFKKAWPQAKFTEIDGIRMDTENEMAIVRASHNGPYLTVKFEGRTEVEYASVRQALRDILSRYSEVDWSEGVNLKDLESFGK